MENLACFDLLFASPFNYPDVFGSEVMDGLAT